MTEFLVQPAGVRLTWSLVHFLWQGAAIVALLLVVLRSAPTLRSRGRYVLSMTALVLMAVSPLATWVVLGEMELPIGSQRSLMASDAMDVESNLQTNSAATLDCEGGLAFQQLLPALQPYLLFAWLMGVLLFGGRLVSGYLGTLWLKNCRTAIESSLAHKAVQIGRRLGVDATGRVFGCSRVPEAIAVGFLKPIVLVPACWLTELPCSVLEAVIAHELAHIRRWDIWATLVQRVIETLLFYHPAVWWLSRRVSLEREMCCDELAVMATGRPVVYAQVLEYLGGRSAAVTSLALATSFKGAKDMNLLTRVQNVLGMRTKPEAGRVWAAGVLSMILAVSMLTFSVGNSGRQAVADDEPATSRREGALKDGERKDGDRETPRREGATRRATAEWEFDRKPADGERRRSAEGERRKGETGAIEGFQPQNAREEGLYKMILELRRETAELRDQVHQLRGAKEGSVKDTIRRDGDKSGRPAARDGDAPTRREARDGEKKVTAPRDGEERKAGPRDGDERKSGARDGDRAKGEGDKLRTRDGEERKAGPRDGDERKAGPRDGEERKAGPREGDGADRAVLLRRVALDLTGQLPTKQEVLAFIQDPAADDVALARAVDRYVASLKPESRDGNE